MHAAGGPRGSEQPPFSLPPGLLDREVLVSGAQDSPWEQGAPQADTPRVLTLSQGCNGRARHTQDTAAKHRPRFAASPPWARGP